MFCIKQSGVPGCRCGSPPGRGDGGHNTQNNRKDDPVLIELTAENIQADIAEYEARLVAAESKLSELPTGYVSYPEYKKREAVRQELEAEITHVKQLLTYATEALNEQGGV